MHIKPRWAAVVWILTHGLVFCTDSCGVMQHQHLSFKFPACLWLDLFIHHNHSFPDLGSFYLIWKKNKFRNEKVSIWLGTVTTWTLKNFLPYYVAINKKREREMNFDTNNIFGNDTVGAISRKMSLSSAEVRNVLYRQCEVCGGANFTYSCACTHSSADSPHLKNLEARVIPVTMLFNLQFNA